MQHLKTLVARFVRSDEGASLVEYGLLVGLIAVVCVLAVAAVGLDVFGAFDVTQQHMDSSAMSPQDPTAGP